MRQISSFRRLTASIFLFGALVLTSGATAAEMSFTRLAKALRIDDSIPVMRDEGLLYGADIADEMFPEQSGGAWPVMVDRIYDAGTLSALVLTRLESELAPVDLAPLIQFFEGATGQTIVELEISTRRALLDEELETAAISAGQAVAEKDPEFGALLAEFIEVNDLIEANVVGALNASYAFYSGLAEGGAFTPSLTQDQILSDVWGQEDDIRAETQDWLWGYLALAYGALGRDELRAYIALSKTPEGRALNQALFIAYDAMYNDISMKLGLAAAGFLAGEDL